MSEYEEILQKLDALGMAQANTTDYLRYFFSTHLQPFLDTFWDFFHWIQDFLNQHSLFISIIGISILIILTLKWLSRW